MRGVAGLLVIALAGCGFSPSGAASHDGGPPLGSDAAIVDASHGGSDAALAIDAGSGSGSGSARTAQDLLLGAGRTTVGTITVDIQLGAGPQATSLTAGSATISGQTVIQP